MKSYYGESNVTPPFFSFFFVFSSYSIPVFSQSPPKTQNDSAYIAQCLERAEDFHRSYQFDSSFFFGPGSTADRGNGYG